MTSFDAFVLPLVRAFVATDMDMNHAATYTVDLPVTRPSSFGMGPCMRSESLLKRLTRTETLQKRPTSLMREQRCFDSAGIAGRWLYTSVVAGRSARPGYAVGITRRIMASRAKSWRLRRSSSVLYGRHVCHSQDTMKHY